MNEAHEVQLECLTASFLPSPFDLVLGVEKRHLEGTVEWQIVYGRVLVDARWFFLSQTMLDEIDVRYEDMIGEKLFQLTVS